MKPAAGRRQAVADRELPGGWSADPQSATCCGDSSATGPGDQPPPDFRLRKPASRMSDDPAWPGAEIFPFDDAVLEHLVEQPCYAVASDPVFLRKLAPFPVSRAQRPRVCLREGEREAVRKRQRPPPAEAVPGKRDTLAIQLLGAKPRPDEFRSAVFPALALVQQIGNRELERRVDKRVPQDSRDRGQSFGQEVFDLIEAEPERCARWPASGCAGEAVYQRPGRAGVVREITGFRQRHGFGTALTRLWRGFDTALARRRGRCRYS